MANENKRSDDSISEEASAIGQRVKGAVKDGVGATTGNTSLEREGERENAEGRKRQAENDAIGGTSRPRTPDSGWSSENLVTGLYRYPGRGRQGVSGLDHQSRIQSKRHQRGHVRRHAKTPLWRREAGAGV